MKSGAQVAPFFPLRFPLGRLRINLRNHRKILVIDGKIGFTGGINISRRHLMASVDPKRVEDLVDFIVARILDHLEVKHDLMRRWGEER